MLFVILYSISNEILDIMPAFEIGKKLDIKTRINELMCWQHAKINTPNK